MISQMFHLFRLGACKAVFDHAAQSCSLQLCVYTFLANIRLTRELSAKMLRQSKKKCSQTRRK